jgi:23S rRNA (adenine2030-N6)-methyltransferase
LTLFDPAYEVKSDYRAVVETLVRANRRFAPGIFALWYPILEGRRSDAMEGAIRAAGIPRVQVLELGTAAPGSVEGMAASGMLVVNPPWTLAPAMELALPWLSAALRAGPTGHFRVHTRSGEP